MTFTPVGSVSHFGFHKDLSFIIGDCGPSLAFLTITRGKERVARISCRNVDHAKEVAESYL